MVDSIQDYHDYCRTPRVSCRCSAAHAKTERDWYGVRLIRNTAQLNFLYYLVTSYILKLAHGALISKETELASTFGVAPASTHTAQSGNHSPGFRRIPGGCHRDICSRPHSSRTNPHHSPPTIASTFASSPSPQLDLRYCSSHMLYQTHPSSMGH